MNARASSESLLTGFEEFVATGDEAQRSFRAAAAERFAARGLPRRGEETWKYNNLKPLIEAGFLPAGEPGQVDADAAAGLFTPGLDAHRLLFVDGVHRPDPSAAGALPAGVRVSPLAAEPFAKLTELGLGRSAEIDDAPFTALNSAWWRDGVLLELAEGAELDWPIELLFLGSETAAGTMACPRVLVRAGKGSRATLIESYRGSGGGARLVNAVGEIDCGVDSEIEHVKLMRDGDADWHLGSTHVRQAAGSRYRSREFVLGGKMTRREVHLDLAGEGALCELNALYLAGAGQLHDLRTRVRHSVADCETHELYKGILDADGKGIFDGLVYVAEDAQRTDAHQTNRNLLISDDATAYSMPRLEIYADDVKCSHGTTTGQIEDEQVFYLRTRGFGPDAARALLTYAFAREIVEGLSSEALRETLMDELLRRLPRSELIGGAP